MNLKFKFENLMDHSSDDEPRRSDKELEDSDGQYTPSEDSETEEQRRREKEEEEIRQH